MSVQNQPIHTYARIKPIQSNEEKVFFKKNVCTVVNKNQDQFGFDGVFDTQSSNEDVYNQTTKNIIQHSFHGFNSCVLAYGQTSSGKTHTMKGTQSNPGIIPLCLRDIFKKIENENLQAQIIISYMEIYNQDIIDLLAERENTIIEPREDKKRNLVLAGLKQYEVTNINDAMNLFQKGEDRRKFACNNLNANSSRSHAIFRVNLRVCDDDINQIASQINLVDLAGSQGIERTKAQKISKIEGENINKSILALTKVIKSMSQKDQQWISSRDSKLTRILQKSLCENSKSTIICMINPTLQNYQECVNTLKFGQMAAKIKINARQNMIRSEQIKKQQLNYTNIEFLPSEKMELEQSRLRISNYEEEIDRLRRINKQLQQENYTKEESILNFEKDYQEISRYVEEMRRTDQQNRQDWWNQRKMLTNKISLLEEEVGKLAKMYSDVVMEKRKLEKNQKSLVQQNQHYENQCKHLNTEVIMLNARLSEESSKMIKPSMQSNNKTTKFINAKPNSFQLPPYKECTDRLSPKRLSWIVQLKTQVIDLGRQVNEFTKANIEIMEDNQELKRQVEEYQSKIITERSSGKINPEALEYNEIKKLNNKIKNLKAELKSSQDRQKKNRQILKKQSHRNIIQIEEFEEWFARKNNSNFFLQISVQTENLQKQGEKTSAIQFKSGSKKMEIQNCQIQNNIHMTPKKLSQTKQFENNSQKGLILGKNLVLIKNQNPEDNVRATDQKSINFLSQPQLSPDENIDMNIKDIKYNSQMSAKSGQYRESFLSDNLTTHQVTSNYSNNSRNFISFEQNIGSKRYSNNKSKIRISNSKITKIQDNFLPSGQNLSSNMIPEEEIEMQI